MGDKNRSTRPLKVLQDELDILLALVVRFPFFAAPGLRAGCPVGPHGQNFKN